MNRRESDLVVNDPALALDDVETDVTGAVALFRSLADPARLAILRHLTLGEHRVVDLTAHLGLAQSTTSAHLACLRDCGLVSVRVVGRSSHYSLAVEPELMDVFAAAERLLAATGDAVVLCPTNAVASADEASPTEPKAVTGMTEPKAVTGMTEPKAVTG